MRVMSPDRSTLKALLFVGPWLLGLVLLTLYPFVASFAWSFTHFDLLSPPRPAGTANYEQLSRELVQGGRLAQAAWNTTYYALVSVPLSIALGVLLAVMLSWNIRGQAFYRTLFFLPSVVPVVASSILWMWLLDPQDGLVNYVLSLAGPAWRRLVQQHGRSFLAAQLVARPRRLWLERCARANEPVGRRQLHDHLLGRAGRHTERAL